MTTPKGLPVMSPTRKERRNAPAANAAANFQYSLTKSFIGPTPQRNSRGNRAQSQHCTPMALRTPPQRYRLPKSFFRNVGIPFPSR